MPKKRRVVQPEPEPTHDNPEVLKAEQNHPVKPKFQRPHRLSNQSTTVDDRNSTPHETEVEKWRLKVREKHESKQPESKAPEETKI